VTSSSSARRPGAAAATSAHTPLPARPPSGLSTTSWLFGGEASPSAPHVGAHQRGRHQLTENAAELQPSRPGQQGRGRLSPPHPPAVSAKLQAAASRRVHLCRRGSLNASTPRKWLSGRPARSPAVTRDRHPASRSCGALGRDVGEALSAGPAHHRWCSRQLAGFACVALHRQIGRAAAHTAPGRPAGPPASGRNAGILGRAQALQRIDERTVGAQPAPHWRWPSPSTLWKRIKPARPAPGRGVQ